MSSGTLVLALVCVLEAFFDLPYVGATDSDDIDAVTKHLRVFGDSLYQEPSSEVGDLVNNWDASRTSSNPEELGTYVEGDILFPESHISRNGLSSMSYHWPDGQVPYVISGEFSERDLNTINEAFAEYHEKTCIQFVKRTDETDYLDISNDYSGCWSAIGRIGGPQKINLQSPGCLRKKGTVIHELMHSIGFFHEQSRYDRDDFVDIQFKNIKSGSENNFLKAEKSIADGMGVEYDYGSIMHYSSHAFTANGKPTIVPKKGLVMLGQRRGASDSDLQKIRNMYHCQKGNEEGDENS
ncbi:metalloendopeptidase activity [Nesidiocoris tenuis]|uniref:Metalloendopeptidase n=1 Tax=Nesidiocoris tenuis TaxID=355587 RepID=A0ABN7AEE7_9HEMI|nr:metalloendopeptidase activity [Nesidiocoris tenuis]